MPTVVNLAPGVPVRVAAVGRVICPVSEIPSLRAPLQQFFGDKISVSILKQADELTLFSLAALRSAIIQYGITKEQQAGWGVAANPCLPGRNRMKDSLEKYHAQGAWSVSPHYIPHCLLHSLSGLLSQALGINGPNMGIGGVPGTQEDVCLGMASWIAGGDVTGGWMVWANWRDDISTGPNAIGEAFVVGVESANERSSPGETGWKAISRLIPEAATP
ncbi:hypothetical protein [Zavarzinella formosa]|uniref:hypothetical protein n=1 Tax=Zavarzinella formosa TaxID=360055 RepID=UPI00030FCFB1|nr:hypothetical protein [Zavarzinella formosa]